MNETSPNLGPSAAEVRLRDLLIIASDHMRAITEALGVERDAEIETVLAAIAARGKAEEKL